MEGESASGGVCLPTCAARVITVSHILIMSVDVVLLCQKGLSDIDDQVLVLRRAFAIAAKCQNKASAKSKNATAGKGKAFSSMLK